MSEKCVICGGVLPLYGKSGQPPTTCSGECRAVRKRQRRTDANRRAKELYAADPARRARARTYARERQRMKAADPALRAHRDQLHREWTAANREHLRERGRARSKSPARRAWTRRRDLRRAYGITPEEFAAKLATQGGRCAICGTTKPGGKGNWHLDHDHAFDARDTRGHRGLLCHGCNTALGAFDDSPRLLRAAASYLQKHA